MTTLADVRDFLKTFNMFEGYGIGRIEESKSNILGVYSLRDNGDRHVCIGRHEKFEVVPISLLIHGNTNKDSTEKLANNLYEKLENCAGATINNRKVNIIRLHQDKPVDVDVSESKIYEYVIEVSFYVEKEEK